LLITGGIGGCLPDLREVKAESGLGDVCRSCDSTSRRSSTGLLVR
jgi:hypothetical protein